MVRGTNCDAAHQQAMLMIGVNIAWIRLIQSRRLLILCKHNPDDDSEMAFSLARGRSGRVCRHRT
eukprot:5926532-Pleurochrysis_carterae.AAC.2